MNLPLREIAAHARATYPQECCGLVLADAAGALRFVAIDNVAGSSEISARTKRDGYVMDPKQLLAAMQESDREGGRIHTIVHSHPDAGAYFSPEDRRKALGDDGEPLWPGVNYLVVSVRSGRVDGARIYTWNSESRDFAELELTEIVD
jgi:proteasome lid subunit RPN8/RPN11